MYNWCHGSQSKRGGYFFVMGHILHSGEPGLANTCTDGILVIKSNQYNWILNAPRYNKNYWIKIKQKFNERRYFLKIYKCNKYNSYSS